MGQLQPPGTHAYSPPPHFICAGSTLMFMAGECNYGQLEALSDYGVFFPWLFQQGH